jgi:hypothetical protein
MSLRNLTLALSAVSKNTNGLYWGFKNISHLQENCSFSKDEFFLKIKISNILCINCAPILKGKFLSEKCSLYTHKYGTFNEKLKVSEFERFVLLFLLIMLGSFGLERMVYEKSAII